MKKSLLLFSATLLVLTSSCSNDEKYEEAATGTLLPKKIVETMVENGESASVTYTMTYDGNKLKDIRLTDDSRSVYTYTGDLITKVELFDSSVLYSSDDYAYSDGKLVSKITTYADDTSIKDKLTFVYNANGTVNVNQSRIINGQEVKYDTTTLYTFSNGNIVSIEYIDDVKEKITSVFDDKKSPFNNITGVKFLLDLDTYFDFYSMNNTVKNTTETYNSSGGVTQTAVVTSENKYNESNFLIGLFSGDTKNSVKLEISY
ncbi:hypothetical protein ACMDB5_06840 [Flavobacterium sp. W1B]|uniref:hypothetical protein n=1 Tax=Flavobacterium sp. W1B TaxID=3394146 RepID=UPI0039BC3725